MPPLGWFVGHVLDEVDSATEADHGLIDRQLPIEDVMGLKVVKQRVDKGSQFVERIVSRLSFLPVEAAVIQVQKSKDKCEPIPFHGLQYNYAYTVTSFPTNT